jgi:hypothetical protein
MSQSVTGLKPKQGKTIRTVTMRFDMTDDYDAATYNKLTESGTKSYRERRTFQARYLLSVILGVRKDVSLYGMGLADVPELLCFKCVRELTEQIELEKAVATVAAAHKKRPSLRLIPENAPPQPPISA